MSVFTVRTKTYTCNPRDADKLEIDLYWRRGLSADFDSVVIYLSWTRIGLDLERWLPVCLIASVPSWGNKRRFILILCFRDVSRKHGCGWIHESSSPVIFCLGIVLLNRWLWTFGIDCVKHFSPLRDKSMTLGQTILCVSNFCLFTSSHVWRTYNRGSLGVEGKCCAELELCYGHRESNACPRSLCAHLVA